MVMLEKTKVNVLCVNAAVSSTCTWLFPSVTTGTCKSRRAVADFYASRFLVSQHCDDDAYLLSVTA